MRQTTQFAKPARGSRGHGLAWLHRGSPMRKREMQGMSGSPDLLGSRMPSLATRDVRPASQTILNNLLTGGELTLDRAWGLSRLVSGETVSDQNKTPGFWVANDGGSRPRGAPTATHFRAGRSEGRYSSRSDRKSDEGMRGSKEEDPRWVQTVGKPTDDITNAWATPKDRVDRNRAQAQSRTLPTAPSRSAGPDQGPDWGGA